MAKREKFTLEYHVNSSPDFLFSYISTPAGLSEWFADDVTVQGEDFRFSWEGSEERAKLLGKRQGKFVKFAWESRPEDEFFMFEIVQDELTGDVALLITDFEYPEDLNSTTMIYGISISKLKQTIGG